MTDRRLDRRFRLIEPSEGNATFFLDVIVEPSGTDEWIAISREPAQVGESLMLDIMIGEPGDREWREQIAVWVIDSRPVILDGDLRHRIRLQGSDLIPGLSGQVGRC